MLQLFNNYLIGSHIKMNKNQQNQYLHLEHHKLLSKKLSNIEEDLQLQCQIRMPSVLKKKKIRNEPSLQFNPQLNRILKNDNKFRKNSSSLQNYDQFVNSPKHANAHIRSQNLPNLKPLIYPRRNKSSLDKILLDRTTFAKAYFEQLNKAERMRKNQPEQQQGVQFEFPEIKVGNWKVNGYLKQDHILLKGTNKDGRLCIKKYDYKKIYQKIRKDYQSWIQSKFCFEV